MVGLIKILLFDSSSTKSVKQNATEKWPQVSCWLSAINKEDDKKIGMSRIRMEIRQRHHSCGASPKGGIENGLSSVMDITMLLCLWQELQQCETQNHGSVSGDVCLTDLPRSTWEFESLRSKQPNNYVPVLSSLPPQWLCEYPSLRLITQTI